MAIADVYDAITSFRFNKPAMSHEQVASIIMSGRGTHFDPDITDAFEKIKVDFRAIAEHYAYSEGFCASQ